MTNKYQSGKSLVRSRCFMAVGLLCLLIISSGGIILAEQNTGITINPVADYKIGSNITISGTYPDSAIDFIVVFISPKSYLDAQKAFWNETSSQNNSIYCSDDSDYCEISRKNPDGTSLIVPYPKSPDCWSTEVPVIKGQDGVNTWKCTFDGTIGERIMQPDTYIIQVGGYEAGDLVEETFKIIKA